ncbi:hypothetical protein H257_02691 [Aphanomyces astaci]|uniref:Uncharacterized protein n=1 Tax=Aphanomyces astaci TaxID=112090 RepID=W4H4T0_APHAT|nr:hypothetical protein H257_02691 [Aphanomyces astaci]ETV86269.1 hypothetical protein H257_02691 [Aphanomyces astaci]RQM10341.1 hypothetical protein B5M09_009699 [Aphanomyces astaci]|eukprot:XP_009824741.1 hypothetical protein H257_02691 [Aphanomyces astaci]
MSFSRVLRSSASSVGVRHASSLSEVFSSVPTGTPASLSSEVTVGKTTKGLGLASSSPAYATTATLGVVFNTGSRHETAKDAGISLLASKMAFRATKDQSDLAVFRDIEAIGGSVSSRAGRDYVSWNITVAPEYVNDAAAILAESLFAPRHADWDINTQKEKVAVDEELFHANAVELLVQGVHAAAFYDNRTLGRSIYAKDNLSKLNSKHLEAFYAHHATASNLVLVGRNIAQASLIDVANTYFADIAAGQVTATTPAAYVGGEHRTAASSSHAYVAVGFSAGGALVGKDLHTAHVLEHLLTQRSGPFSTGFAANYADASLVGLSGVAKAGDASALTFALLKDIQSLASQSVAAAELEGAKKSSGLGYSSWVESKDGSLTQLARSAKTQKAITERDVQQGLAAVTAADVQALAQKLVASKPLLASVGNVAAVPRYDDIVKKL